MTRNRHRFRLIVHAVVIKLFMCSKRKEDEASQMRRGISITHLKGLLAYAKSERDRYVPLERQELDLIIRELTSRRNETKKLRLKRNKQTKQILDLAGKIQEPK